MYNPALTCESMLFKIINFMQISTKIKKCLEIENLLHNKIKNNFSCWWTVRD